MAIVTLIHDEKIRKIEVEPGFYSGRDLMRIFKVDVTKFHVVEVKYLKDFHWRNKHQSIEVLDGKEFKLADDVDPVGQKRPTFKDAPTPKTTGGEKPVRHTYSQTKRLMNDSMT